MSSNTPELSAIVHRLDLLEQQNRRLKWVAITMLVVLSAVALMGQAPPVPRVIEAQKFVLKDADGNVRGWMGVVGKGSELILGNDNAQPMMRLLVSSDASDLHLFGSRNSGMNLGIDSGNPAVSMVSAEAKGGVGIRFSRNGPSLNLEDGEGFSTVIGSPEPEPLGQRRISSPFGCIRGALE